MSLIVQLHRLLFFLHIHVFLLIHTVFSLLNPFTAKLSVLCLRFRFPLATAATNFLSLPLATLLCDLLLFSTVHPVVEYQYYIDCNNFLTEYEELDKHARKYIHKKMKVLKKKLYTGMFFSSIFLDVKRTLNELLILSIFVIPVKTPTYNLIPNHIRVNLWHMAHDMHYFLKTIEQ